MLGAPTDADPSQLHVEIEKLKEENSRLTKEIKDKSERLEQLKNEAN
jgi:FtsZ-binding cell division protein ZapB